jgi:hypothetical protein
MKALEADPSCAEARYGLRDLLLAQRRGFRLEQVYWKLLSRLDLANCPRDQVLAIWEELATLLERRRSGRIRAQALRHLMGRALETEPSESELPECDEDEPIPNG